VNFPPETPGLLCRCFECSRSHPLSLKLIRLGKHIHFFCEIIRVKVGDIASALFRNEILQIGLLRHNHGTTHGERFAQDPWYGLVSRWMNENGDTSQVSELACPVEGRQYLHIL